ncbi:hypothetical protein AMAG_10075 [Allomyces macrogynus ATCC 38327]|uniref:Bud22 domain-containing protein n=1 Tax=Allomyces macrogynus (strain ATCC 38327) TaxID=578462 RepID=A0A0L0SQD5_ALLM3|nr:hypothetical protein AMAG_10075 [Allomyces macrogynus ATCC 38327]|eukprot:KNE64726.1 hypothetical protein AMAG_10075 [Allomyces macrogynus ATCC 38327]
MAGAHSKHGHGKRGARRGGSHGGGNRRGPKPVDWADLIPAKMHHARKTLHQAARKAKQFEAQKLIKKLKSDPSNTVLASRLDRVKHAHLADLADHWFHRLLSTTVDLRAWADKFVPTTTLVLDDAETVSLLKGSKAVRDGIASIAADLMRLVARSLGKTVESKPGPASNGVAESNDAASSSSDEESDGEEDVVMAGDDARASSGFNELGAEDLVRSGDEDGSSDDEDGDDSSDDDDGSDQDGSSDGDEGHTSITADADVAIAPDFTDPIVRAALRAAQKRPRADSSSDSDDADDSDDHVSWSSDDEDGGRDAADDMYDSDGELIPEAERAERRAAKATARPALDDSDDEVEGGKKEEKKKKRKNRPGQQARKKRFLERTGQAPPPPARGRGRGRGRGESGPGARTFDGHGPASESAGRAPFRGHGRGAPAGRGAPSSRGGFAGRGGAPPSRGGFADRGAPSSRGGITDRGAPSLRGGVADRGASAPRGGFAGRGGPSSRGAPAARGTREDATAGNLHPSWEAKRAERERLQALAAAAKPTKIVFDNDD